MVSRFHPNETEFALIDKYKTKISKVIDVGSSLKACLIAKGEAEISYRMSPNTKEWDTAATQLIVQEAGGVFLEPDKKTILYNRKDVYNRKGYIICNKITNFLI